MRRRPRIASTPADAVTELTEMHGEVGAWRWLIEAIAEAGGLAPADIAIALAQVPEHVDALLATTDDGRRRALAASIDDAVARALAVLVLVSGASS